LFAQVDDLHRHFIDDITIPSSQGKGLLRRIDDVFDCWFESGSMPYGQVRNPALLCNTATLRG
jgi:isoleucyl-tRNA synthetase